MVKHDTKHRIKEEKCPICKGPICKELDCESVGNDDGSGIICGKCYLIKVQNSNNKDS